MNFGDERLPPHFWVNVKEIAEHWLWIGAMWSNGYGRFNWNGVSHRVHRLVFEIASAETDLQVLHKCDIRICCAPSCLFKGTQLENVQDRAQKNRTARGARGGNTQITEDDVREIRRLHSEGNMTQFEIGSRFGIGQSQVSHIVLRRVWRHVK